MKSYLKFLSLALASVFFVACTISSLATNTRTYGKSDKEIMIEIATTELTDEEAQQVADFLYEKYNSSDFSKEFILGEYGPTAAAYALASYTSTGATYDPTLWNQADDNLKMWLCFASIQAYIGEEDNLREQEELSLPESIMDTIEEYENFLILKYYGIGFKDMVLCMANYGTRLSSYSDEWYDYLESRVYLDFTPFWKDMCAVVYDYLWPAEEETTILTTITNRFRDMTNIARATNVTNVTEVTNVTAVTNVSATNVTLPY